MCSPSAKCSYCTFVSVRAKASSLQIGSGGIVNSRWRFLCIHQLWDFPFANTRRALYYKWEQLAESCGFMFSGNRRSQHVPINLQWNVRVGLLPVECIFHAERRLFLIIASLLKCFVNVVLWDSLRELVDISERILKCFSGVTALGSWQKCEPVFILASQFLYFEEN